MYFPTTTTSLVLYGCLSFHSAAWTLSQVLAMVTYVRSWLQVQTQHRCQLWSPDFSITWFNYFLKEGVYVLMFSCTVTGFFLLCALKDSNGNKPCSGSLALSNPFTCWSCRALAQPPCPLPRSRSSAEVWRGRTGKTQLFPLLMSMRLQERERQPCSARTLKGGHGPQSHFQYGYGILSPS